MIIKSLELRNFRNYEKQAITFCDGINILYGQNAQGKTNILEALYIAATGKSHRTNYYHDLVQYQKPGFELRLNAVIDDRESSIVIKYLKDKGRYVEVNRIRRDKLSDILGTLNIILFSPETLEVVKGSPQIRRKFLDILLCQTNRQYLYHLKQYNLLIKNKSLALKRWKYERKYEDVIPIWNDQISSYGGKIAFSRMKAINQLNIYMKDEMHQITYGREASDIRYKTFCKFGPDSDEGYLEKELKNRLDNGIEKEKKLGQCLYGPHRDDFEILLNGKDSRQYCSQGQKRTLSLSLIIGELHLVEEIRGEKPVLLLDDVMSELDSNRQKYLIEGLYNVQTMITTTDSLPYNDIMDKKVKKFLVKNGTVSPVDF